MDTGGGSSALARRLVVGDWNVQPLAGVIEREGEQLRLQPRIMDLLLRLAMSPGEVVPRAVLLRDVWNGVAVSEDVLTRSISVLRQALGDARHGREYVTTIAKRGYVLNAAVTRAAQPGDVSDARADVVAVQRFADDGGRGLAAFCEALRDELVLALGALPGVRVAAGVPESAPFVLEGSVRSEAGGIVVSARLVGARDGLIVWAESLRAAQGDESALRRDAAAAIAGRFSMRAGARSLSASAAGEVKSGALAQYALARAKYLAERPSFRYDGLAELELAIELDDRFAAAHGLHAYVNAMRSSYEAPYPHVSARVRSEYQRALALDPLQPEALMAKALDVRWRSWDWAEMRLLFEQALRVAPGDPHVLAHYAARFFRELGELGTAERMLRRALARDANNVTTLVLLASVLRFRGDFAASREQAERARDASPHHSWALLALALASLEANAFAAASETLREIQSLAGIDHRMTLEVRGRLEARSGDEARSRKTLARMRSFAREDAIYAEAIAWVCFELGELDEGASWLERALDQGASACSLARVCMLPIDARRPGLFTAPRFQAVLARMHLDDASLARHAAAGLLDPPRNL
jgi:DNA-binding winged helix-turn-helix (wHTH) protein/tetratricopeptide (TPR) repeat protein